MCTTSVIPLLIRQRRPARRAGGHHQPVAGACRGAHRAMVQCRRGTPMKPLVAIVGRPNVGKSTLFNKLVGQRLAIVEDLPGTTRDRLYADAEWNGRIFTVIDTCGLELGSCADITARVAAHAPLAIQEADVIVPLLDARDVFT